MAKRKLPYELKESNDVPDILVNKSTDVVDVVEVAYISDVPDAPAIMPNENGIVVGCLVLNIRQTPSEKGIIESRISKGTKVKVVVSESVGEFYKVVTKEGVYGFCVKQFIKLY